MSSAPADLVNAVELAGRPATLERFPWAGHLGLNLLQPVIAALEPEGTTLLFTNTRSQAELWYRALVEARPDWLERLAIHHGSIARDSSLSVNASDTER